MALFNITNNKIVIEEGPEELTVFPLSSGDENQCPPYLNPPIDMVAYHDGNEDYPVIGDKIYADELGNNVFTTRFTRRRMGNDNKISIDDNSIFIRPENCF